MSRVEMRIGDLFRDCNMLSSFEGDTVVKSISFDSRFISEGALFFAIKGDKSDGRQYITQALSKGVSAVVVEGEELIEGTGVPLLRVQDIRLALSDCSARFYGNPSDSLCSIGVTGTNGKTSISWIISEALKRLSVENKSVARIGTLGMHLLSGDKISEKHINTSNTSPDPLTIHSFLSDSLKSNAFAAVLEVTSQGLVQKRTNAIQWDCGIFSNLSRDHLDLHKSIENYANIKLGYFTNDLVNSRKKRRSAIINSDDDLGRRIIEELRKISANNLEIISYSLEDSSASSYVVRYDGSLTHCDIDCVILGERVELSTKLIGGHNVANVLAAASCLAVLGYSRSDIRDIFWHIPHVPGRLELVAELGEHVVIDYAHTPDALLKAQSALRELTSGRLIVVFGCGGDRDRGKRKLMAEAVATWADEAIVTSDNPRTEDPEKIIDDIMLGFIEKSPSSRIKNIEKAVDREEAIRIAISKSRIGDTVLVAGKGHEDYQEIGGVKYPFSDLEVCRRVLIELGKI